MARTTSTNFTGGLDFTLATAATDLFKKEDVQVLAQAVDLHDHTAGKGLLLTAGSIPSGTITSAMLADGTIVAGDIADGAITSAKILDGAVTNVKLATGIDGGKLLDASVATARLAAHSVTHVIYDSAVSSNLISNGAITTPYTAIVSPAPTVTLDETGDDVLVIVEACVNVVSATTGVFGWDLQLQNTGTYQRLSRLNYLNTMGSIYVSCTTTVYIPYGSLPGTAFQVAPMFFSSFAQADGLNLRAVGSPAFEYLRMTVMALRR